MAAGLDVALLRLNESFPVPPFRRSADPSIVDPSDRARGSPVRSIDGTRGSLGNRCAAPFPTHTAAAGTLKRRFRPEAETARGTATERD